MKRSILVAWCGWLTAGFLNGAVPSPEQLLPQASWLVVTIPDFAQAQNQFQQWPSVKAWQDASMKPLKDKFMTKWGAEVVAPLEKEFGVTFSQLKAVAQGQLTVALTRTGLEEKEPNPGLLVLVDSRDQSEGLKSLLAELKKKWTDSGKAVKQLNLRGVEFTSLTFDPSELETMFEKALPWFKPNPEEETVEPENENEPPADQAEKQKGKSVEWLIGQAGSLLLVGDKAADIEQVLARLEGGAAPALAEQETFAANYPLTMRGAMAYGWIDMSTILQRLLKEEENPEESETPSPFGPMSPQKMMEPLGLLGLQSLSFAAHNETGGERFDFLVNVPAGQRKGLFELFRFEALDADPPAFVPADVSSFRRFRLNLKETLERAEKMLGEFSPQLGAMAKMIIDTAGKDKDETFDLRQSLIANLGNDIISYEKAPRDSSLEALADPPSIYLIGSPKPDQLAAGLKALTSLLPVPGAVKEREFLGRTVFTFDIQQDEGETPRKLHFSPSGAYVALSADEATLEEFLRTTGNPGSALRENREMIQAAQKVGGMSTGLFDYSNQRQNLRSLVESLRKDYNSLDNLFSNPDMGEGVKEWLDFSLLPSFDRIAKYFHIAVTSGEVTKDGYRFKLYMPRAPGSE